MTGKPPDDDPLQGVELSRRELIHRIVVGSAFALPVVASFDMASLGVSSAYANNANQSPRVPPSFTSADTTTFTVGEAGSFTIVTPGTASMVVSEMGTLPSGVTFTAILDNRDPSNNNDATLSGTPTAGTGGVYPLTLRASNGAPPDATQAFTLTVNQPPAFTSPAAALASTDRSLTVEVTTSGYPAATIALSGKLPSGMTFTPNPSAGTAVISGKAGAPGVYTLTLTATNGVGPAVAQTLTLTVGGRPRFTSPAATKFHTEEHGSFEITTVAGPAATVILSGKLPPGVKFAAHPANGTAVLSGTPPASAAGTYRVTLTAYNGEGPNPTQAFVLTVAKATPPNNFTTSHVKTGKTTQIGFDVKVPGPGTIAAVLTAPAGAVSAAVKKKAKPKRVTLAKTEVKVKRGKTVKLKTKPNRAGRRFPGSAQSKEELWLTITYKPTGGKVRSHTIKHLHLK